ncbi:hypothetical protein KSC_109960 [Ktedonobacter sp. SOSP1-52]|uniref:ester cyclase n=1 Tax=Ktedonobacter sp. SOSP1-52 TaxID=2778366 RepID=UPI001915C6E7|nr:ester cyclase [Ktedonobacter sp. SOSP1-52]GHO72104.1 hypothetical protein KSC_109960 [Ktedonobacter sp. SOSP1-52]
MPLTEEETNKSIIRRLMEHWNKKELEAFFDGFASECVFRVVQSFDAPLTRDELINLMSAASAAFPDMVITVEDEIAEQDRVMIRVLNRGTHTGDQWEGIPATYKQVAYREMVTFRVNTEGKIVEWIYHPDLFTLFQQLSSKNESAS